MKINKKEAGIGPFKKMVNYPQNIGDLMIKNSSLI